MLLSLKQLVWFILTEAVPPGPTAGVNHEPLAIAPCPGPRPGSSDSDLPGATTRGPSYHGAQGQLTHPGRDRGEAKRDDGYPPDDSALRSSLVGQPRLCFDADPRVVREQSSREFKLAKTRLQCPCGEFFQGTDEDDLVEQVQRHLGERHPDLEYDREEVLLMAY